MQEGDLVYRDEYKQPTWKIVDVREGTCRLKILAIKDGYAIDRYSEKEINIFGTITHTRVNNWRGKLND